MKIPACCCFKVSGVQQESLDFNINLVGSGAEYRKQGYDGWDTSVWAHLCSGKLLSRSPLMKNQPSLILNNTLF